MTPPRSRPTAVDVARLSGVSTATVSYVLNDAPGQKISDSTRERVLAAAAELGYVQHPAAQALARGASRVVLLDMSAVPHGALTDDGARIISGMLEKAGFTPVLSWWAPDESARMLVQLARAVGPSAVITLSRLGSRPRRELERIGVRTVVSLGGEQSGVETPIARAAAMQVDHLADAGHLALRFAPPPEPELAGLAATRRSTAAMRAEARGCTFSDLPATADLDELASALRAAVDQGTDAVVCYNDDVALRVLAAARRSGIRVPEDLAVIGVDDLPFAALCVPALTTVRQTFVDTPEHRQRFRLMLDPDAAGSVPPALDGMLTMQLVVRESA